jgi:hypothetical protein
VKPFYSTSNWWPQTPPGDINLSYDRTFEGNAYLGGNDKDLFEIAVLILDNETNKRFKEWENYSSCHENALNKKVSGFNRLPSIRFSSPHILL